MQPIVAIFSNGTFIPIEPVQLPEGFRVTLWLDPLTVQAPHDPTGQERQYLEDLAENRGEVLRRMAE